MASEGRIQSTVRLWFFLYEQPLQRLQEESDERQLMKVELRCSILDEL